MFPSRQTPYSKIKSLKCTQKQSLLNTLNFNVDDLKSEYFDTDSSEVTIFNPPYATNSRPMIQNGSSWPLDETTLLSQIEIKTTKLVFDLEKRTTEHHSVLTNTCTHLHGTTAMIDVSEFPKSGLRGKHVEFGTGYHPDMRYAEPYTPLDVAVKKVVLLLGHQGCVRSIVFSPETSPNTAFTVCRLPSNNIDTQPKYLVAPTVIYTQSISLYLKYNGPKIINHKFNVSEINKEVYRKYLILRTLTMPSVIDSTFLSYHTHLLFPLTNEEGTPPKE
uniref:Uncharacterized protein n=1 Tax=Cacopsylla melanoneura TaxID=428564 RepID=A0A8D8SSH2_9HEMI